MGDRVKVGVFGVGSLGQWHARIYSELDDVDLIGVHDVDHSRALEIADRYSVKAFDNVDELARQINAASVVVPTNKHFELFNALSKHKLHILMEKPISVTTHEAEKMVQLAQDNDLLLQVGHVERFNPVMRYLEQKLAIPRFIEATRLAEYPEPRDGLPPRGAEVSVVLDLMIHDLEIILHIVRSPLRSIYATGVSVLSPTEDIANVRLCFENGCVANITASRISTDRLRKIRVFQDDLYLSLDYMNQTGQLCRKTSTGIEVEAVPIEKDDALTAELKSFVECVKHHHDPLVTGEHGSNALKLAVEICRKIREDPS